MSVVGQVHMVCVLAFILCTLLCCLSALHYVSELFNKLPFRGQSVRQSSHHAGTMINMLGEWFIFDESATPLKGRHFRLALCTWDLVIQGASDIFSLHPSLLSYPSFPLPPSLPPSLPSILPFLPPPSCRVMLMKVSHLPSFNPLR